MSELEVQSELRTGPSQDVKTLMAFESNKKSTGVAYLLWFFLGGLGVHRFYLGKSGSGAAMLILFILGWITVALVVGIFMLLVVGIWLLIDAFMIPGMVQEHNNRLALSLGSGVPLAY